MTNVFANVAIILQFTLIFNLINEVVMMMVGCFCKLLQTLVLHLPKYHCSDFHVVLQLILSLGSI